MKIFTALFCPPSVGRKISCYALMTAICRGRAIKICYVTTLMLTHFMGIFFIQCNTVSTVCTNDFSSVLNYFL